MSANLTIPRDDFLAGKLVIVALLIFIFVAVVFIHYNKPATMPAPPDQSGKSGVEVQDSTPGGEIPYDIAVNQTWAAERSRAWREGGG